MVNLATSTFTGDSGQSIVRHINKNIRNQDIMSANTTNKNKGHGLDKATTG